MEIGMIGLGRMGANMTRRLMRGGHEVVVFDRNPPKVAALVDEGAVGAGSLEDVAARLTPPRCVWIMVPAGAPTAATISSLAAVMEAGDVIIDGGNSRYTDTVATAAALEQRGIDLVDAGTSGGIWGLDAGYCLMVGGRPEAVARIEPAAKALAPDGGYAHVGPPGAGHFTKMVHNGIEYGLMQSYGEGFELLTSSQFDLDLAAVAELWRHGSVVRSWLLDLLATALARDPQLTEVSDYVEDSGEGRWTVETAIENAVPAPVIALSLFTRFASRQDDSFSAKVLSALRKEFGGHAVRAPEPG